MITAIRFRMRAVVATPLAFGDAVFLAIRLITVPTSANGMLIQFSEPRQGMNAMENPRIASIPQTSASICITDQPLRPARCTSLNKIYAFVAAKFRIEPAHSAREYRFASAAPRTSSAARRM